MLKRIFTPERERERERERQETGSNYVKMSTII
jgi:hypothetical protein